MDASDTKVVVRSGRNHDKRSNENNTIVEEDEPEEVYIPVNAGMQRLTSLDMESNRPREEWNLSQVKIES